MLTKRPVKMACFNLYQHVQSVISDFTPRVDKFVSATPNR
jgi:hypothetical protein